MLRFCINEDFLFFHSQTGGTDSANTPAAQAPETEANETPSFSYDGAYSYAVNPGGYGSEVILSFNNRIIDYDSVPKVPATIIPADDYVRQPGESDSDYAINRWNRIVENMNNAYPNSAWSYYFEGMGVFASYGTTTFTLDSMTLDNQLYNAGRGSWWAVLELAAGIKPSDSNSQKAAKLKAVFSRCGSVGRDGGYETVSCDMVSMLRYLTGNNPEHVNYFATMDNINAAELAQQQQISNFMQNYSSNNADPTIEVEEASKPKPASGPPNSLENEIRNYIGERLRPIYARYFARMYDSPIYKYFEVSSLNSDIDSSKDGTECFSWKNEEDRQAFWNAVLDVLNQAMAKYGDQIANIYFDGDQPYFILKDSNKTVSCFSPGDYDASIPEDVRAEGYTMVGPLSGARYEDATDHGILFSSDMIVYDMDIPEQAPVDKNGDGMIPTKWPGIYVSKDGNVYAWDPVDNKYKGLYGISGLHLLCGETDAFLGSYTNNMTQEEYDLFIPLLFGLKRTNQPGVYMAQDGTFYKKSNTTTGRIYLQEIDIIDTSSSAQSSGSSGSANAPAFDTGSSPRNTLPRRPVNGTHTISNNSLMHEAQMASNTSAAANAYSAASAEKAQEVEFNSTATSRNAFSKRAVNSDNTAKEPLNKTVKDDENATLPEIFISFEDYEKESEEQAKPQGLIKDDRTGLYYKYNPVTNQKENWLWDPVQKRFDVFTIYELNTSKQDERILNIRMRLQAIMQRLNFTTDYSVCVDNDGNYYDYNPISGKFEIRN